MKRTKKPKLDMALRLAELGWYVFPWSASPDGDKVPLVKAWQKRASKDPRKISEWWEENPDANIAVHCGMSGIAVIDIDRHGPDKPDGFATIDVLQSEHGYLWELDPLEARTARDGRHLFFAAPNGAPLPYKIGPGIELLSGNHWVAVAPSKLPDGRGWEWVGDDNPFQSRTLPQLPDWVQVRANGLPSASIEGASNLDAWALTDIVRVPDTAEDRRRVSEALRAIRPDKPRDANEYISVLAGLKSTGWDDAKEVAEHWARGKLHDYDEPLFNLKHFTRDWDSMNAVRTSGRSITIGTIYHLAKGYGFDPKWSDLHGDSDNAARFARMYRGEFLYVQADGIWVRWDGNRWTSNCAKELGSAKVAAMRSSYRDAADKLADNETATAKDNFSFIRGAFRNLHKHEAMLRMASAEPEMSVPSAAAFDADPYLLGVRNGIVNLRTGKVESADPAKLISKIAGASYVPGSRCPHFMRFLSEIFEGNQDVIKFIQRAVGYTLTGDVREEVLFFMLGGGANGKSVLANILRAVLGDNAVTVQASMLARNVKGNNSDAEREKNRLPGARLALINEVAVDDMFDDQKLKEVTSREAISTRRLYGESYEFSPSHKIWIRAHSVPAALDASDGFWRRILQVRFNRQFAEGERDVNLEARLLEERDGILLWAIEGCLEWQRDGLKIPASVRADSDAYRSDSDLLGQWLEDRTDRNDVRAKTRTQELLYDYRNYLERLGVKPPTAPSFGRQLKQRKFIASRTGSARFICGLRLLPDEGGGMDPLDDDL